MADLNSQELRPPRDWEKFEEICADLFSSEWNDPHVVRYGRSGQSQHGVDIFGKKNGAPMGVQCKSKRAWPPTELTIAEVNGEIKKAKQFTPKLDTYIFVTTAENDARMIDHVNHISDRHIESGLFKVYVYGWTELVRRLCSYPSLLEKHFDAHVLAQVSERIKSLPEEVAGHVVQQMQALAVVAPQTNSAARPSAELASPLQTNLTDALERDFAARFSVAMQRSLFPESQASDEFNGLAHEVLDGAGRSISATLRRAILLRAARSAAIRKRIDEAEAIFVAAQALPATEPAAPAEARVAFARGNPDAAMRVLRDARDADSRSVLLNIIAMARGDDPVAEHLRLYEKTKTTEALRALVGALVAKKDHVAIARYAEQLYSETHDPRDIAFATQAFANAGDSHGFVRLVEAHPFIRDLDVSFSRNYGWQLFRLGRHREARRITEEIARKDPKHRDLDLEIAIAIETGDWEDLAGPLAAALLPASNLDGLGLIRAANLAQASGQGRLMDLVDAAVKKSPKDPDVLINAYSLAVEEGQEERRPETHDWFQQAIKLSGPDGPVQSVELKEILAQQLEWNEHARKINELMARGEAVKCFAGSPESYVQNLQRAAMSGTCSKNDFLPSSLSYWENIAATRKESETLSDYVKNELADERRGRIERDGIRGIEFISLSFGAPELVPRDALTMVDADLMLGAVRNIASFRDPFAAAGAFDVCADRCTSDESFIDAGDAILDRLLADPGRTRWRKAP